MELGIFSYNGIKSGPTPVNSLNSVCLPTLLGYNFGDAEIGSWRKVKIFKS
jgi:hypothetical protein